MDGGFAWDGASPGGVRLEMESNRWMEESLQRDSWRKVMGSYEECE